VWLRQPQFVTTPNRFVTRNFELVDADTSSRKMSRYTRPAHLEAVRWTEHRRRLLLTALEYRVITREMAQLRLYSTGARSQVQRDLTHLWRSGILSKVPNRAPNACDIYELSRSSPRGLRQAEAWLGQDAVRRRAKRPPAVDHALAVNDFRARIELSVRCSGFELETWLDEFDLNHLARHGVTPDGFFEVTRFDGDNRRRSAFFVEVEVAPVSRAHWRRRLAAYHTFYYSGAYAEEFDGRRSLRLLVVAGRDPGQLRKILEEASASDFSPIRLTSRDEMWDGNPQEVLSAPIWRSVRDGQAVSLF
jgi:hypothetical protein